VDQPRDAQALVLSRGHVRQVRRDRRPGRRRVPRDHASPTGTFTAYGTYTEIVDGEKLVFTHHWDEGDRRETLVTVTFADKNGGTEVTLVHSGLASAEAVKGHGEGWTSTLNNLAKYLS